MASGLDESADGHLMTTMQSGHELHNLYTLHFKLPLSNANLPTHTHTHTHNREEKNHKRDIQEKPLLST